MVGGKGIRPDRDPSIKSGILTGYIVLSNENWQSNIEKCLRTERFSVQLENGGGILHNCYITKSALRDIEFPEANEIIGCGVALLLDQNSGKGVIIGIVNKNDQSDLSSDRVYTIKKTKNGNISVLSIDGNGEINIDIAGIAGKGKLNINLRNPDSSTEMNVHVKGNVNVYTEGNINLKAVDGTVNIESNKSVDITSKFNTNVKTKKFSINNGGQPMVLGKTLQDEITKTNKMLEAVVNSLKNWIPVSGDGGAALKTVFKTLSANNKLGDFSKINSTQSFLD